MVTAPHTPVPFSPVLEDAYVPTPDAIAGGDRARTTGAAARAGMSIEQAGHAQVGPVDDRGRGSSSGSSRRARRSPSATRSPRSRPRRSTASSRPRRRACCAAGWRPADEVIPVGGLLGVIADAVGARRGDRRLRGRVPGDLRAGRGRGGRRARAAREAGGTCATCVQGEGGEPLVLLHGFGGDLNNWLFNAEALSARARGLRARPARATAARSRRRATSSASLRAFLDAPGHRARPPRRALDGRPGGRRVRGCRARPRALADADRPRRARRGDRRASTSTGSSPRPAQASSSRCCSGCSPTPTLVNAPDGRRRAQVQAARRRAGRAGARCATSCSPDGAPGALARPRRLLRARCW